MKTTLNKILLLFIIAAFGSFGCDNLLDVNNPNSVLEENLDNPSAANAIASGALSTTANAVGYCLAPYTVATDEAIWIGSRDAWNQLDRGFLADFNNEFVDAAWPYITEARYTCDNAIALLNGFKNANTLRDPKNLVKAYLYSAVTRLTIADMFDDFVYSNKREAKPPIGENNMVNVYNEAIAHLDAALVILQTTPDAELQRRALGLRARAKHAKAVWGKVNPKPAATPAANPYVTEGADDAQAALAIMTANYRWQFTYPGSIGAFNEWAWEVVGRSEMNTAPVPKDIVDTAVDDPRIANEIRDFKDRVKHGGDRNSPFTVVSEREMQLILAESKVVSDPAGATTILNALRARDGLKPLAAPVTVGQLLQHERRANLYMMGRRLADMYRFGIKDSRWVATSDAINTPGSFFPITIQERRANQFLTGGR
ncbi:MAG: hypothetical protein ONB46_20170 [candidate division KSB1 bacterium]|nr:hypothetical protein [candidate division KSB1 bacterium]MDZ7368743.1 hypothetical protein [candidate division KSB1 bacterium]MDZ7406440.1 hypothetical protein [candidate division KSB1 bacterium]